MTIWCSIAGDWFPNHVLLSEGVEVQWRMGRNVNGASSWWSKFFNSMNYFSHHKCKWMNHSWVNISSCSPFDCICTDSSYYFWVIYIAYLKISRIIVGWSGDAIPWMALDRHQNNLEISHPPPGSDLSWGFWPPHLDQGDGEEAHIGGGGWLLWFD